jgi:hypothetical protein
VRRHERNVGTKADSYVEDRAEDRHGQLTAGRQYQSDRPSGASMGHGLGAAFRPLFLLPDELSDLLRLPGAASIRRGGLRPAARGSMAVRSDQDRRREPRVRSTAAGAQNSLRFRAKPADHRDRHAADHAGREIDARPPPAPSVASRVDRPCYSISPASSRQMCAPAASAASGRIPGGCPRPIPLEPLRDAPQPEMRHPL